MQLKLVMAASLAAVALAGCADDRYATTTPTTTTTTVTRDYWGNPVSQNTTVRDAYGNPVASRSAVAPGTVYSGSSMPPAVAAPVNRDCRATPLHQDRPGGSDYDPARGYSC